MSHDEFNPDQPPPDPQSTRPGFQRAATAPWPTRVPSSESLPHMNHQAPASSGPLLRKRHSTFVLSQNQQLDQPPHPFHHTPPLRPPRNPARTGPTPEPLQRTTSNSRPSTAASTRSREDVGHHDVHPNYHEDRVKHRSGAPSVKSHASSGITGPIEEVTPWELEPVPPLPTRDSTVQAAGPGIRTVETVTTTGPIEEVTPWELYAAVIPEKLPDAPINSRSSQTVIPTTGTREDVTPWELYPSPDDKDSTKEGFLNSTGPRSSLTMTKSQIEVITPWDLFPAPAPAPAPEKEDEIVSGTMKKKNSRSSTRPSSSSGTSKALSELGIVRRRRSTDSKSVKSRSGQPSNSNSAMTTSKNTASSYKNRTPSVQSHPETSPRTSPTTPRFGLKADSVSPLPTPVPTPTTSGYKYAPSGSSNPDRNRYRSLNQDLKFSTADRTILEELKRNINARAAHFVIKGKGCISQNGGITSGKKYHAYPREEVPYPRSYDREVVDLDVWETTFLRNVAESFTWHIFEKPPTRVLDIGCGTGTWILNCARTWKECQFVGLDIVPIQPDLQQVDSPDLASRITWVQANFLDSLPFPNEEFDYVHIKRIALGVPENNWTTLFAEIERVMKPGGALEVIEEDLFFPGHSVDNDEESTTDSDADTTRSRRSSLMSNGGRHQLSQTPENGSLSTDLENLEENSPVTPTGSSVPSDFPNVASHPDPSTVSFLESLDLPDNKLVTAPQTSPSVSQKGSPVSSRSQYLITPHSRSAARPLLQVKTSPYSRPMSNKLAGSAISLMSSMGYAPLESPPNLPPDAKYVAGRRRSSSIGTSTDPPSASTESSFAGIHTESTSSIPPASKSDNHHTTEGSNSTSKPPKNSTTLAPERRPINPRDHSVIEYIYREMLASRFINISPISVLGTYMEFYFKDVRTHPPLLFSFPAPIPDQTHNSSGDNENHSDDARDAIIPSGTKARSTKSVKSGGSRGSYHGTEAPELTEGSRFMSMEELIKRTSPYVSLDFSRGFAFAPKTSAHGKVAAEKGAGHELSRLPNTNFRIDLQTLHLHLALRASEIIACSESMWEWVVDHQSQTRAHKAGRTRAGLSEPPSQRTSNSIRSDSTMNNPEISIDELTRDDFNALLSNFSIDMQDQMALGRVLESRFGWTNLYAEVPGRKAFDTAVKSWPAVESSGNEHHYQPRPSVSGEDSSRVPQHQDPISRRNSKDPVNGSSLHGHTYESSLRSSLHPSLIPPTRRLSRSMRVFVGWKAED